MDDRAPEIRVDPFTGASVIVAAGRRSIARTPAPAPTLPNPPGRCPFCPEHEDDTEVVTHEERGEDGRWLVRVVRNRFPLVRLDLPLARGEHEVIVETPEHDADLTTLSVEQLARVLRVYRHRVRALSQRPGAAAVVLFRNRGRSAGSSQPHPHAQVVSLPMVPLDLELRAASAASVYRERGVSVLSVVNEDERRAQVRVVRDEHGWLVHCPFASARAFETRLSPTFECARFAELGDAQLDALASALGPVLRAHADVSGSAEYNVVVREPPIAMHEGSYFVIDIISRHGGYAGFELGAGTPVCTVAPEQSAAWMRERLERGA